MFRRIKHASLAARLIASFVLIIIIFFAEIIFTRIAFEEIESLHHHNTEFMTARTKVSLDFHREFTEMRSFLRESFMNPEWRYATSFTTWRTYERRLSETYGRLVFLSEQYKESVRIDERFPETEDDRRIYLMRQSMSYVDSIYYVFTQNFFQGRYMNFEHEYILDYAWRVDEMLVEIRDIAQENQHEMMTQIRTTQRNMGIISTVVIVVALVLSVIMAISMVRTFMSKIKCIEAKAEQIASGDFSVVEQDDCDEISQILLTVVNVFKHLINEINDVMLENRKGNTLARICNDDFHGGYKDAAIAINALLESITDSHAREQEVADRLSMMLDGDPSACLLINENFDIVDCNKAAVALFGFKDKEDAIANSRDIFIKNDIELLGKHFHIAIRDGFDKFEIELEKPSGERLPCAFSLVRFALEQGNLIAAYILDMSAVKQMFAQQEKVQIAQANSEAKSKFLAKMSHEIRTPISAVLGIAEIQLQNTTISLEVEEAFAKIYNSGNILLGIVNDILDLSKIEAGKMDLFHEKYEVASLISDITLLNLAYMGSKQISFVVDIDETIPSHLIGDELRIKQVLNNLLSNAFKYTEQGNVTLAVVSKPSDIENYINVAITIRDTGRGMTEEQLLALFDEFTRFHEKEARFVEGTGLGMSITSSILNMMNATMDIDSEVGMGTQVTIVLPQEIGSDVALGAETAKNLRYFSTDSQAVKKNLSIDIEPMPYGRVLIVDDIDTNLYVASGLMKRYKMEIETVTSGFAAIDKIKNGEAYDIIFMDQMMPKMNGTETTAILRQHGYTNPIVALTANALVGQADEYMKNGFDGFLSKPLQMIHLNGVLQKFVKERHPEEAAAEEAKKASSIEDEVSKVREEVTDDYMQDPEMQRVIRQDFVDTQANALSETITAISNGDMETAQRVVHTLKGHAALMSENVLASHAEVMEKALKNGDVPEGNEWDLLEEEFFKVLGKIKKLLG